LRRTGVHCLPAVRYLRIFSSPQKPDQQLWPRCSVKTDAPDLQHEVRHAPCRAVSDMYIVSLCLEWNRRPAPACRDRRHRPLTHRAFPWAIHVQGSGMCGFPQYRFFKTCRPRVGRAVGLPAITSSRCALRPWIIAGICASLRSIYCAKDIYRSICPRRVSFPARRS
jgi:hypothetical protein